MSVHWIVGFVAVFALNWFTVWKVNIIAMHGSLLRAVIKSQAPGISPSYHECAPRLLSLETQEKWNQTKSVAFWFPAYLFYLPGNLQS